MREIKFRAVDKETKQIYDGDRIERDDSIIVTLSYGELVAFYVSIGGDYEDLILNQCTGLKDKNGKEIYEGDILHLFCDCDPGDYAFCTHPPTVHKVVWNEEEAGYDLVQVNKNKIFEDFSRYMEDSWEIIGNIYENPELLEGN